MTVLSSAKRRPSDVTLAARRKSTLVGCAVLVALGVAVSTSCKNDASKQEKAGGISMDSPFASSSPPIELPATGPSYSDEDFELHVSTPVTCNVTAPFLPEAGYERLSVPVRVSARGARMIPISPLSFTVEDGNGRKFGPTLAGCKPALASLRLKEGQKHAGEVAFDVPANVGALELVYEPFVIGRPKVRARVKLPAQPSAER